MNRNISIIVTLLVLVVIVGYLIWLRSRIVPPVPVQPEDQVQIVPTAIPTIIASASATPSGKEATKGAQQKSASPGATKK